MSIPCSPGVWEVRISGGTGAPMGYTAMEKDGDVKEEVGQSLRWHCAYSVSFGQVLSNEWDPPNLLDNLFLRWWPWCCCWCFPPSGGWWKLFQKWWLYIYLSITIKVSGVNWVGRFWDGVWLTAAEVLLSQWQQGAVCLGGFGWDECGWCHSGGWDIWNMGRRWWKATMLMASVIIVYSGRNGLLSRSHDKGYGLLLIKECR